MKLKSLILFLLVAQLFSACKSNSEVKAKESQSVSEITNDSILPPPPPPPPPPHITRKVTTKK